MGPYRVAFFGHRDLNNIQEIETVLYEYIANLLIEKGVTELFVGRNGCFDICVSSVIRQIKKEIGDDNCIHSLVLPYPTLEYIENVESFEKYFDEIYIFDQFCKYYPKNVISARNRFMVDQADLIVCYVERESGGAYAAMKYALNKGKDVVNLFKK